MKDENILVHPPATTATSSQAVEDPARRVGQADKIAVQGTNDGSMDWQEAHERWAHETRDYLSPAAFAKRIMDLGGGNNVRQSQASAISSTSPAPAALNGSAFAWDSNQPPQSRRTPTGQSGKWSVNHGAQHTSASSQTQSMSVRELRPAYQVDRNDLDSHSIHHVIHQQQTDIDRLETQVGNLSQAVDHLTKMVNRFPDPRSSAESVEHFSRSHDAESFDLLAETVSNLAPKIGEIDAIKLNIDACKRRLRRLEESQGDRTNKSLHPEDSTRDVVEHVRSVDNIHQNITPPSFAVNEDPQSSSHRYQRLAPRGQPAMRGPSMSLVPRKRGRPPKSSDLYGSDGMAFDKEDQDDLSQEHTIRDEEINSDYPPITVIDRGRVIRRGSGVGFGEQSMKRTRQKPIRMPDGSLMRKDGQPDKRSMSSAMNLKKKTEKGNPSEVEARTSSHVLHEAGAASGSRSSASTNEEAPRSSDQDVVMGTFKQPSSIPNRNHEVIMKKMFPRGLNEKNRRMDHAKNMFSANRSPEQEKAQPRREMQREEITDKQPHSKKILTHSEPAEDSEDAFPTQTTEDILGATSTDLEMTEHTTTPAYSTDFSPAQSFAKPPPPRSAEIKARAKIREAQETRERWEESQKRFEESNGRTLPRLANLEKNAFNDSQESYRPGASDEH